MRAGKFLRWSGVVVTALLALLLVANVPFYSGSTLGSSYRWRMEHGRMTVERRPRLNPIQWYVAFNSEGLRWSWNWKNWGNGQWELTIPLWTPLLLSGTLTALAFRHTRSKP